MLTIKLERLGNRTYPAEKLEELHLGLGLKPKENEDPSETADTLAKAIIKDAKIYETLRNESEFTFGSMRFMGELAHFEGLVYKQTRKWLEKGRD